MIDGFERATSAWYLMNCLKHRASLGAKMRLLSVAYDADGGPNGVHLPPLPDKLSSNELRRRGVSEYVELDRHGLEWRDLAKRQLALLSEIAARRATARPGTLQKRLLAVGAAFQLGQLDLDVLGALIRYDAGGVVRAVLDDLSTRSRYRDRDASNVAVMLGLNPQRMWEIVQSSMLVESGLTIVDDDGELMINSALAVLLRTGWRSEKQLMTTLLGKPSKPTLRWEHYDHIAHHRDHLSKLLASALKNDATGINILIYGTPGTGKTEFAKTLAHQLGASLFPVGEGASSPVGRSRDDEPSRNDRLSSLRIAQRLMVGRKGALLMVDEASDLLDDFMEVRGFARLFGAKPTNRASKVFLNRTLEQTPVPTIWVMNHAGGLSQAIVRRFTYVFEVPVPSLEARADVWMRLLRQHGFRPKAGDGLVFAKQYDVAPAVAETAVKAAGMTGRDVKVVHKTMQSLQRALTGKEPAPIGGANTEATYDPALLVSTPDIRDLFKKLKGRNKRRCTILLSGKPGTGKSAYARELAGAIGMEVLHIRCSDIMDMYVGENERKIAEAFARARDNGQFLVIDEADALLQSRGRAHRSWEVSMVAEMLTWLESHPYPLCFTVNSTEQLDEASLRRFDYKVELHPLKPEMCHRAFTLFFRIEPTGPAALRLSGLLGLTPGDFAVVARRARIEGYISELDALSESSRSPRSTKHPRASKATPRTSKRPKYSPDEATAALVGMLEHELESKKDMKSPIGFGPMRR